MDRWVGWEWVGWFQVGDSLVPSLSTSLLLLSPHSSSWTVWNRSGWFCFASHCTPPLTIPLFPAPPTHYFFPLSSPPPHTTSRTPHIHLYFVHFSLHTALHCTLPRLPTRLPPPTTLLSLCSRMRPSKTLTGWDGQVGGCSFPLFPPLSLYFPLTGGRSLLHTPASPCHQREIARDTFLIGKTRLSCVARSSENRNNIEALRQTNVSLSSMAEEWQG